MCSRIQISIGVNLHLIGISESLPHTDRGGQISAKGNHPLFLNTCVLAFVAEMVQFGLYPMATRLRNLLEVAYGLLHPEFRKSERYE
jgi:hypothetical protein